MTQIRFKYAKPSAAGNVPLSGTITCAPTRKRTIEGEPDTVVLPVPFTVELPATGTVTVNLDPTAPDWAWRVTVVITGASRTTEYVTVPNTAGEDYPDLVRVDPDTLAPDAAPEPAWWAALDALPAGVPGQKGDTGAPGAPGAPGPPPTQADVAYAVAADPTVRATAATVATHTGQIAANTTAIAANGTAIAANTTAIAGNATAIANNTTAIAGNTTAITANNNAIAANKAAIAGAADPLAYLNSIDILCSWDTRPVGTEATYPQGVSINADAGEIYVANQGTTWLRIDVRNMDGTLKSSKSITTDNGAYTEGMPWFYNANSELCFFVRTGVAATENTYNIYNYTLGTLGPQIAINGLWKASVQGNTLITTDARNETIKRIFVYDWASVQAGTPSLLTTIYVETSNETAAKNQGLVLNSGYIFLLQGAAGTNPTITVYNLAGRVVTIHQYTRADYAGAVNAIKPGLITDTAGYTYENEAGCTLNGKLVSMDVVNSVPADITKSKTVLTVHNTLGGVRVKSSTPATYVHDTGWVALGLLGAAVTYASDTIPRIRRIGNAVYLEGAIKGLTAGNVDVATIPAEFLPQYNRQHVGIFGSGGPTSSWQVQPGAGTIKLLGVSSGTIATTSWLVMTGNWLRA